jgi:hypothetical protein
VSGEGTGAVQRLEDEVCDVLPRRDTPALVNITTITAVNLALAVNAASPGATAVAWAGQWIGSVQH